MTLTYQSFTSVLLIYGSLFLSGIHYCLRVFWCAAARMSELKLQQRTNIKFLVKLRMSGKEIRQMLVHVYGDNALEKNSSLQVGETFSEERESVTDEERSGRTATSRTEENIVNSRQLLRANRRLTVRSIAEQVDIDRETFRKILTEDLDMRKVCAKMIPKELTEEQKQRRVTICQDLLERQDGILGRDITGDETWVTNTTLKRSGEVHNGKLPIPHDQKYSVGSNQGSKNFADFFLYQRDCSLWICTKWTNSQPSLLLGSTGKGAWWR